jgi:DNA-binding GntR family transcriptional regulator
MAKRDQLISRGARLLDIPTPEPSQPDEIAEVRKLVEGATAQAQAAENAAKAIDAINKQQADLMRELIAKMPVQKDIP